jgi:hypothetical protein
MTDDEYQYFLTALARKHLRYGPLQQAFDVAVLRSTLLTLKLMKESGDSALINSVVKNLTASQPVNTSTGLMESSGILDALDDAHEIVLGELRSSFVPNEDADFLRSAGLEEHEIDVLFAVAIRGAHAAAASGTLPSDIAADAGQKMASALVKLQTLTPDLTGAKAKRKYLNAIGKLLSGAVAAAGNVLLLTEWSSPSAGAGAIASCSVAIGSFFAGLGDLKGE